MNSYVNSAVTLAVHGVVTIMMTVQNSMAVVQSTTTFMLSRATTSLVSMLQNEISRAAIQDAKEIKNISETVQMKPIVLLPVAYLNRLFE